MTEGIAITAIICATLIILVLLTPRGGGKA